MVSDARFNCLQIFIKNNEFDYYPYDFNGWYFRNFLQWTEWPIDVQALDINQLGSGFSQKKKKKSIIVLI